VLLVKTELDNPFLNSIWSKMQSISIEECPNKSMFGQYASVSTKRSSKTTTDSSVSKDGDLSKGTQHYKHRSIDRKHTLLHVKFEVGFTIALKSMSKKSGTFSWGMVRSFQTAEFENS
jgi:hypothetical protein